MTIKTTHQPSDLMERMKKISFYDDKPQNLPFDKIVEEVKTFLQQEDRIQWMLAYGNESEIDSMPENQERFDPITVYKEYPDEAEMLFAYVEADLKEREAELLNNAHQDEISYKILLFGIAIKLAKNEEFSPELRELLVQHLVDPRQFPKKKAGRPATTDLSQDLKVRAITYAKKFGLDPTRNEESLPHRSACDAVTAAARKIYQEQKLNRFKSGFGYENLRRQWTKSKRAEN